MQAAGDGPGGDLDAGTGELRRRVAGQQQPAGDLRRRRREAEAHAEQAVPGARAAAGTGQALQVSPPRPLPPTDADASAVSTAGPSLRAELDRARERLREAYEQARAVGYRPGSAQTSNLAAVEREHERVRLAYRRALGDDGL